VGRVQGSQPPPVEQDVDAVGLHRRHVQCSGHSCPGVC
jgi:hypothetical protein